MRIIVTTTLVAILVSTPVLAFELKEESAPAGTYLYDQIKNPSYFRALANLLKNYPSLPSWTKQLLKTSGGNYVGGAAVYRIVDGTRYEAFNTCKPHECDVSWLRVMFSPSGTQAWGAIAESGKSVAYLGAPNPAQRAALNGAVE